MIYNFYTKFNKLNIQLIKYQLLIWKCVVSFLFQHTYIVTIKIGLHKINKFEYLLFNYIDYNQLILVYHNNSNHPFVKCVINFYLTYRLSCLVL